MKFIFQNTQCKQERRLLLCSLYLLTDCAVSVNIRVVSILQKSRYLKCQVMGSNTLLWGMSIPIFKLLPLKLRSRWNAQFYEAISLNFHLIKYSDAWKLAFFSLKWSWNDFKVKYASIEVKKCQQTKFGVNGFTEWDFMGVRKH